MNLSIVIPTFNSGQVIKACLDSIIDQLFQPIEVLVIDNLSQDDTSLIVSSYTNKHPWIKFFSAADRGIYDAMNTGILMAKSEWLYFMGSDDKFASNDVLSDMLKVKFIAYDVVYGDVYSLNSNNIYDGIFDYEKLLDKNICHQAIFFRKSIFTLTGKFKLSYSVHADWDNNIKWFTDKRVRHNYIDQVIAIYGAGGVSSTTGDDKFLLIRKWKSLLYYKADITFFNRLRMLKALLRDMSAANMYAEMIGVLLKTPLLLTSLYHQKH